MTGWWGGNMSYTWSRAYDNIIGMGNYYSSSPENQNSYTYIPWSPYYNPDLDYGRSVNDTPHKIVMAPTIMLPFGQGQRFVKEGKMADLLLGGWSLTPVVTFSSGFPMGVTQSEGTSFLLGGQKRPDIVPGQPFLVPGDLGDRITSTINAPVWDNMWYNPAAFSMSAYNRFGNAPRMLPGVYSVWRKNVDLAVSKSFKTGGSTRASLSMDVMNLFNIVQWRPPTSSSFGSTSFGQVIAQSNFMRMIQFNLRFSF